MAKEPKSLARPGARALRQPAATNPMRPAPYGESEMVDIRIASSVVHHARPRSTEFPYPSGRHRGPRAPAAAATASSVCIEREPTADERAGMDWRISLDGAARYHWLRQTDDTGGVVDAWQGYKRAHDGATE